MSILSGITAGFRNVFRRRDVERALDDELRGYIELSPFRMWKLKQPKLPAQRGFSAVDVRRMIDVAGRQLRDLGQDPLDDVRTEIVRPHLDQGSLPGASDRRTPEGDDDGIHEVKAAISVMREHLAGAQVVLDLGTQYFEANVRLGKPDEEFGSSVGSNLTA